MEKIAGFESNSDDLGRRWTARRVLQNRRLQVRFLSHLPGILNLWGLLPRAPAQCACFDPYLTPIAYHQEHTAGL